MSERYLITYAFADGSLKEERLAGDLEQAKEKARSGLQDLAADEVSVLALLGHSTQLVFSASRSERDPNRFSRPQPRPGHRSRLSPLATERQGEDDAGDDGDSAGEGPHGLGRLLLRLGRLR